MGPPLIIPPDDTSDASQATAIAHEIMMSGVTFSQPDEPCNADKMSHARAVFGRPDMDIFTPVPFADVFQRGDPAQSQAASFVADLRCQYINKLVVQGLRRPAQALRSYIANRIWYVRLRTQLGLVVDPEFERPRYVQ